MSGMRKESNQQYPLPDLIQGLWLRRSKIQRLFSLLLVPMDMSVEGISLSPCKFVVGKESLCVGQLFVDGRQL